jgi:hypothetical protein
MHVQKFLHLTMEGILLYGRLIFEPFKFSLWQEMNKLHTDDVEIQQLTKNSIMEDDKWATLLWMFIWDL